MYNRYNDLSKFITDNNDLKLVNGSEVYISSEENYGIVIDLEDAADQFDALKPMIISISKNICKLDNTASRFNTLHTGESDFPFDLAVIFFDSRETIRLDYWGTSVNTQFDVVFTYKDNEFILKSFGMKKDIPSGWDKENNN